MQSYCTILLAGLLALALSSCKKRTSTTTAESYQTGRHLENLDDPEKDSFIHYGVARGLFTRYDTIHMPKTMVKFHDDTTRPGHIVDSLWQGCLIKKQSIDSLAALSGCDKFLLKIGMIPFPRKALPSVIDTVPTIVILPVKSAKDPSGRWSYHLAANVNKTSDTTGLEYSSPCPPYCPK